MPSGSSSHRPPIDVPPAAFARHCLEAELLGPPSVDAARQSELLRGVDGAEQQELHDWLTRPVTPRHRRFRTIASALTERLAEARLACWEPKGFYASAAASSLGDGGLLSWAQLDTLEESIRLERDREVVPDPSTPPDQALVQLKPVWLLVGAVGDVVTAQFPALGALPWVSDWLLQLAAEWLADGPAEAIAAGTTAVVTGGWLPRLQFVDPAGSNTPVQVRRSASRETTRRRILQALRAQYQTRLQAGGRARVSESTVRRRLSRSDDWERITAALERFLDGHYPPGTRPYALDGLRQVRRDVLLWAAMKIDGTAALELSADHADRFEAERDFRARKGGRRPRLPRTEKGVQDAMRRADAILTKAPI